MVNLMNSAIFFSASFKPSDVPVFFRRLLEHGSSAGSTTCLDLRARIVPHPDHLKANMALPPFLWSYKPKASTKNHDDIYIYMYIYHYIPRSSKGCVSWMIRGAYTPPLRLQTAPELEDAGVKWQAKVIYKWKTCLVNAGKIHVVVIVNLQLLKFSLVLWNLMRTSFSGDLHQLLRLHQPNHGVTWRKFPHHVFELHSLKRSQQFCPSK